MSALAVIVGTSVPARMDGRVIAAFERAFHARGDDGALVMVLAQGLGPSPHGVVVPADLPEIEAGGRARIEAGELCVEIADGTARRWRLDGARRYEGSLGPSADEQATPPSEVGAAASAIRDTLVAADMPSGYSQQARDIVAEQVVALARGVRTGDTGVAEKALARLVGLGPGLTPSGDDALVGFLAARWALAGNGGIVACRTPALLPRTTDVSASYLALACEGRFAEPIASLARAVARGDAAEAAARARTCLSVGVTSGADALGGFLGGYSSVDGVLPGPVGA